MAAWRYEISLLVLKKYFTSERSERVKYFSILEEKFRISARPCNILSIYINQFCCIFTKNTTVAIHFSFYCDGIRISLLRWYPYF